jgi:hypothetical protein
LQRAQGLAAKAEKEKPRKRPRQYNGKSKRTLRRHRKQQKDLAKQGYLPLFDYTAHMKEKAAHQEQLIAGALEGEQVSEESAPESDTEALVFKRVAKCVAQVRCRDFLMQ